MKGLTREDFSMLPAWVGQNEHTVSFFEWLTQDELAPWNCKDIVLVKVKQRKDYFLYTGCEEGHTLKMETDLKFAGIFRWKDCGLYDLKESLRRLLEIPEEIEFPTKAGALKEAEAIVNQKALALIGRDWGTIFADARCEKELMLPKITRSEIRNQADKYYEAGKTAEEIFFRPEVPVARYFSDRCYLLFLDNKEWVAEKVARQWVLENAAYISRQQIWYGCIRDEFMEIKKAAERQKQGKQTD